MAREFDASQVSNWAENRKKGAGSVGGAAAGAAGGGDAAAARAGSDADAAAGDDVGDLGQQLRAVEEAANDAVAMLEKNKLPAADVKKFRKPLDKVIEDYKTLIEDVGELADDYEEAHAEDEKDDEGEDEDDDAGSED